MDEQKQHRREVRALLIGDINHEGDKIRPGKRRFIAQWGIGDGAAAVILFGVSRRRFELRELTGNEAQRSYKVRKAMQKTGREVELTGGIPGCYINRIFMRPMVLSYDVKTNEIEVSCGRTPLAIIAQKRAKKLFMKALNALGEKPQSKKKKEK